MESKSCLITLGIGVVGATAYGFYEYMKWLKRKSKEGDVQHILMLKKAYASVVMGKVELIAGSTDTRIDINKFCSTAVFSLSIQGSEENVLEAESLINRIIEAAPEMTSMSLNIPKDKVKIIVGNFGSKMLSISQETGCKVYLICDPDFYEVAPFSVEIEGPRTEIIFASNLLKEVLAMEPVVTPSELEYLPKEFPLDIINESKGSSFVGVIVSYILSVSDFWVQLDRLSSNLENMERRLSDSLSASEAIHLKVKEPKVGLFVVVPNAKQGKWHRAKIVSVTKGLQPSNHIIMAQFVDYGDSEEVNLDEIRLIPAEYLSYPFFAVECCLEGVSPNPANSEGEKEWSEEALDVFEAIVFKSRKILMARKEGEVHISGDRTIPTITLVDTNGLEDKVIAAELVERGYARWTNKPSQDNRKEEPEVDKYEDAYTSLDEFIMD